MRRSIWLAVLAGAAPLARSQAPAEDIDFAGLNQAFLEEHCGGGTPCDLAAILERDHARLELGVFELRYPTRSLAGKRRSKDLTDVALGLLDLQRVWVEWLTAGGEEPPAALADLAVVRGWVDGWKARDLERLADEGGAPDLADALAATDEVRAAQSRLVAFLHDRDRVGLSPAAGRMVQVVLCPSRLEFMGWVAFVGARDEAKRAELYVDGVDQWTQFWSGQTLILAMEYSPWTGFDPEFRTGKDMTSLSPTGIVEHVALQAGMALMHHCVQRPLGHPDNALVMNMVIDFVGSISTMDGESQLGTSGASTQPYERFVPGGDPNGGTLPAHSAAAGDALVKSQWRKDDGKGHFLKALRKGQKEGAKLAKKSRNPRRGDKTAHFLLRSGSGKYLVSAPFLGPYAGDQRYPPQAFLDDYAEFFRAYKSGFFDWLRVSGGRPAKEVDPARSAELFRDLLWRLDELPDEGALEQAVQEIYGLPLSGKDDSTDSLEWRFLAFLAGK